MRKNISYHKMKEPEKQINSYYTEVRTAKATRANETGIYTNLAYTGSCNCMEISIPHGIYKPWRSYR